MWKLVKFLSLIGTGVDLPNNRANGINCMVVGQLKFYTYEGCTCAIFVPSFVGINKANTMAVVAGLDILVK